MATDVGPREEIEVVGEIDLGEELVLEPILAEDPKSGRRPRKVHTTLSPAEQRGRSRLSTRDLEYLPEAHELRPGTGRVSLKDKGLVLQYGILGKPGSGKTHLLMHMLRQIIAHRAQDLEWKYGGLILDPKAALIDDVRRAFRKANREDDLIVVNTRELKASGGTNAIDCMLRPTDLGEVLVLAARSAGLGSSEPYWILQMSAAFGAMLTLMRLLLPNQRPTLSGLMELAVGSQRKGDRPALDGFLDEAAHALKGNGEAQRAVRDCRTALDLLRRHTSGSDPRNRVTAEQFMQQAFGVFQLEEYECYSADRPVRNLYDRIVDEGKFVLVSMGPQEVKLAALLPALIKLIFQRTVISRFDRFKSWELHNNTRPVLFMADEYHTVATKVPGAFGDSEFFSQCRQPGALSIVATQSVQQLMVSSLEDAWKAVFDVLSAVIVMSGNDPETAEYVDKLAGRKAVVVKKRSPNYSEGKESIGMSYDRQELPVIPLGTLQKLKQGEAVVIGKLHGPQESSTVRYLKVPPYKKED